MDKSEMKSVMEKIEKKLKGKATATFMEHTQKYMWKVLQKIFADGHRQYEFNGVRYNLDYVPSLATPTSVATFPEFRVSRFSKHDLFNADTVLAKKEITVRGWACAPMEGYENPIQLIDDDQLFAVVRELYNNNPQYNLMIQRHDTGDVTIWTDTKRFTQR